MTCADVADITVIITEQCYFPKCQITIQVLCCRIIRRYRTVRCKLRPLITVIHWLSSIHNLIECTISHKDVLIKQPHRCFTAYCRKIQIKGYILPPSHISIPIPIRRVLIKAPRRKKQADLVTGKGNHRNSEIINLVGIKIFLCMILQCFSVGSITIYLPEQRILFLIQCRDCKWRIADFITCTISQVNLTHFAVIGQIPISDISSRKCTKLLNILSVCQRGIKVCLIQFSVSYYKIVDASTVAVIQITVKFGIFGYNIFSAEKFLIVRLVKGNSSLLKQHLFQGNRLWVRRCILFIR